MAALVLSTSQSILQAISITSFVLFFLTSLITSYFTIKIIQPITSPLDKSYLFKIAVNINAALFQSMLIIAIYAITFSSADHTLQTITLANTTKLLFLETINSITK